MNMEKNTKAEEFSLAKRAFELLEKEEIDISLDDIKNLMEMAPNIKEMFLKVADSTFDSSKNVMDLLKQVIEIYQSELKREDLSQEQRENIYDRMDRHAENAQLHDDKNKRFMASLTGVALTAVVGATVKFGPNIIKSIIKK